MSSTYYQIPVDISAIYLDNTYAQISFTTPTIVNPNYYYNVVVYDASGNYYSATGTSSPITVNGLTLKTQYSCYVELVQYSTSTLVVKRTLPWPKVYSIYISDVSYNTLKVSWVGVDISYLTVTRAIGSTTPVTDISTSSTYITSYTDGDISGNTTYYYYITPYLPYNGVLNKGAVSATVSTKTLPAPPTNVTSSFYDSSSVSVSFATARNSYSTSYYYILRTTDATRGTYFDVSGETSPIQNSDLSGNTTYTMRVISAIDNSIYTTSTSSVTRTTLVRPPTNIAVTYFDSSAIRVSYSAGKNTYSTIYYTLYASDAPRNFYTSVSGSTTALSVSNLSGNTSYTLGVINTLNGNTALSATTVYGSQLTLAQAPYSPYQSFVDSSSISVTFSAGKNSYTSVLYTATATDGAGASKSSNATTTTVNVGDLSGNTKYTIIVNTTLDGNAAITATALSTVSSRTYVQPPTDVATIRYDSSSVTVGFSVPKNSYATSAYYSAYITDGVKTVDAGSTGNVIVIQGLSNSTSYSYYVKTVLSARSSIGTVATYNPYPVIKTITISEISYNSLNVNWSGSDISYVRVSRGVGGGATPVDISYDYATPYYDTDISGNTTYSYYLTPIRNYKGVLKVGAASSVVSTTTPVSPPKNVTALFYDYSGILLGFTSQRNSYNTGFYYTARASDGSGNYRDVVGNSSPILITNLSGLTTFTCSVRITLDGNASLVAISTPILVTTTWNYAYINGIVMAGTIFT